VQLDSGAGVQIRRTVGLNNPPPLQSLALQKETEPRPVALSLRIGAGEDPPEHRLLGYWQSSSAQDQGNGGWPMEPLVRDR